MYLETSQSDMILSLAVLLATLIFTILLAVKVKKERAKYKEEQLIILEGLLSKTAMDSALNGYLAKITPDINFSLMLIEIDNFNEITDAFGKKEAEKALEKVAYFMSHELPRRVLMSNYKTTQFLVFMKSEYDRLQCIELGKKLLEIIKKPIKIYKDTKINLTASIGICFYPKHGKKQKQLMNSLSIALHNAKRNGGDNFVVYSSEMINLKTEDTGYHFEIKEAMDKKEFVLYYQPIVNQKYKSLYGVEALVRWNHPKHGILSPVQFINVMEQSGDINWIGTWGLESLIQEYFALQKDFPYQPINFTMNLSPKQLMNENIANDFNKVLKKYNMSSDLIILEVSDYSIYEQNKTYKQNIMNLKKVGFKIAINGVDLDNSSLAKLETMPIDVIKFDKHFFEKDKESFMKEKIINLLVEFASNNSKIIISEGIENEEMIDMVDKYGIELVQGYYYSKPILTSELNEYIRKQGWTKGEAISYQETANVKEDVVEEVQEENNTFEESVNVESQEEIITENTSQEEEKTETIDDDVISFTDFGED